MNHDLILAGLGLPASLGLAAALWAAVAWEWWRNRKNKEARG